MWEHMLHNVVQHQTEHKPARGLGIHWKMHKKNLTFLLLNFVAFAFFAWHHPTVANDVVSCVFCCSNELVLWMASCGLTGCCILMSFFRTASSNREGQGCCFSPLKRYNLGQIFKVKQRMLPIKFSQSDFDHGDFVEHFGVSKQQTDQILAQINVRTSIPKSSFFQPPE